MNIKNKYIFELSIVDNKEIHKINKEYRKIDKPTDVISFAFLDNNEIKNELIGEIFISHEKIYEQAKEYNHSIKREYLFLFLHGLLHLLGYDHKTIEEEKIMFGIQDKILSELKITK